MKKMIHRARRQPLGLIEDWDIGDGRKILADEIRARDGAGLKLHDDAGHGVLVKDGGSLEIETTTSANTGVIYKGVSRFIHDYAPAGASGGNTFIGIGAGNFTMTAPLTWNSSYNNAIGRSCLQLNTVGGYNNAMGGFALYSNTTGMRNTGVGSVTLKYNKTGNDNVAIGSDAGRGVINASNVSYNIFIGRNAGFAIRTGGNNNVLIGHKTGDSITIGHDNIIIGYDKDTPAVDTNNHLNIGGLIYGDLSGGTIGIGTVTQTAALDINSDILRLRTAKTPASAGAAGNTGDMCADANYFYRCVSTNSWKRAALNAW